MTPVQPLPSVFIIIILIITTTTKTPLEFFIITHVIIIITPHCDFHGYNSHQSTTRLEKRLLLLLNAWWCSNSCIKPGAGFQLKTKTTEERNVGVMHFRQYIYGTTMSQPTLVVFSAPPYINDDYVRSRDISHCVFWGGQTTCWWLDYSQQSNRCRGLSQKICHVMVMNVLFKQMTTKVTTEFSLATSTNDSMDCFHMVKNSKH